MARSSREAPGAGWNLVTSGQLAEALNFNRTAPFPHHERYQRAHEFAEVVQGLWDSWDDDAFVRDKDSGLFFEPDKMHYLNHKGKDYSVRGPLNVPRSPQGQPVLVQAGASDDGKELAAEFAEAIFSPHLNIEAAKSLLRRRQRPDAQVRPRSRSSENSSRVERDRRP